MPPPLGSREGLLIDEHGLIANLDPASYLRRREERVAMTVAGRYEEIPWHVQSLLVDTVESGASDASGASGDDANNPPRSRGATSLRRKTTPPPPASAGGSSGMQQQDSGHVGRRQSFASQQSLARNQRSFSRAPRLVSVHDHYASDAVELNLDLEAPLPLRRRHSIRRDDALRSTSTASAQLPGAEVVFRDAPPAVASKIAAFVARFTRSAGDEVSSQPSRTATSAQHSNAELNWLSIGGCVDALRAADHCAIDTAEAVASLQQAAARGLPAAFFKGPSHTKTPSNVHEAIHAWEADVHVAIALLDVLLVQLVGFAPALMPACTAVRRTLLGAIFYEGCAYADAVKLGKQPARGGGGGGAGGGSGVGSGGIVGQATTRQALLHRVATYMMRAFGVDLARAEHATRTSAEGQAHPRHQRQQQVRFGDTPGEDASPPTTTTIIIAPSPQQEQPTGNGPSQGLMAATMQRRLRQRATLVTRALQQNLTGWRDVAMRLLLRNWRSELLQAKRETRRNAELTRARGEVELLTRKVRELSDQGSGKGSRTRDHSSCEARDGLDSTASANLELQRKLSERHRRHLEELEQLRVQNERLAGQLAALREGGRLQEGNLRQQLAAAWDALRGAERKAEEAAKALLDAEEARAKAEAAERDMAGSSAELAVLLATVLRSLTGRCASESAALGMLTETSRAQPPGSHAAALAQWVTEMAQRTLQLPEVRDWLSVAATRDADEAAVEFASEQLGGWPSAAAVDETRDSARANPRTLELEHTQTLVSLVARRLSDGNSKQEDAEDSGVLSPLQFDDASAEERDGRTDPLDGTSAQHVEPPPGAARPDLLLRVIDFTEGPLLLDGYAAMLHAIDATCVTVDDVLRVFGETDRVAKAETVLALGDHLVRNGHDVQHCGGLLRLPSEIVTAAGLAARSSSAPDALSTHVTFVAPFALLWLARMSAVEAPAFISGAEAMAVSKSPREWLRELRTTSQRFEGWKAAVASLMRGVLDGVNASRHLALPSFGPPSSPLRHASAPHEAHPVVADVSPDARVRRTEERMLVVHSWTRRMLADYLRVLDSGKRRDALTAQQQTVADDILQVVRGASHMVSSVFRFYATLTSDAAPSLVLGANEAYKLLIDMGIAPHVGREELREILQSVSGMRKRIMMAKTAAATLDDDDGAGKAHPADAGAPSLPHQSPESERAASRHTQIAIEEFAPFLLHVMVLAEHRKGAANSSSQLDVASLPLKFSSFVTQHVASAALLDVDYVQEISKLPQVCRTIEAHKKPLRAVFGLICAQDPRLEPRGVIAQSQFTQLVTDMGCMDDSGVSFVSVSGVFIHALQIEINKPMLMCFSEFVVALVAISCMKFPSPYMQVPAKVVRFLQHFVMPFFRRRCLTGGRLATTSSRSKAATSFLSAGPSSASAAGESSWSHNFDASTITMDFNSSASLGARVVAMSSGDASSAGRRHGEDDALPLPHGRVTSSAISPQSSSSRSTPSQPDSSAAETEKDVALWPHKPKHAPDDLRRAREPPVALALAGAGKGAGKPATEVQTARPARQSHRAQLRRGGGGGGGGGGGAVAPPHVALKPSVGGSVTERPLARR